jgi:hypothetical protein
MVDAHQVTTDEKRMIGQTRRGWRRRRGGRLVEILRDGNATNAQHEQQAKPTHAGRVSKRRAMRTRMRLSSVVDDTSSNNRAHADARAAPTTIA